MSEDVKLTWNGVKIADEVHKAIVRALSDAAEFILDESNKEVPHDEGTLQASGLVSVDASKLEANVSYDTPYAVRLHEHPEYRFQKGRKGKWLENTLKRKGVKVESYLEKEISKAFNKGR